MILSDFVPELWKDFVLQQKGKSPQVAAPISEPVKHEETEYEETGSKPRVRYQPDPEY